MAAENTVRANSTLEDAVTLLYYIISFISVQIYLVRSVYGDVEELRRGWKSHIELTDNPLSYDNSKVVISLIIIF